MNIYLTTIIPILATIIGAFFGFIYQNKSEKNRDKKSLLAVLMASRGLLSREDDFVKTLNMIDIYFYDNKKVRVLCHDYFKHLYSPLFETGHHTRILLSLILAMAKDIGYTNLESNDITDFYFPARYNQQHIEGAEIFAP